MADRGVSAQQKHAALIEAYEEAPGNYHAAAKSAGVSDATAKKAWEEGWPRYSLQPIKEYIDEIREAARAARIEAARDLARREHEIATKEQAAAKADAVSSLKQEGMGVKMARGSAIALESLAAKLIKSASPLADALSKMLQEEAHAQGTEDATLTANQIMLLLERLNRFTSSSVSVMEQAMRMERLLMGRPELTVQVEHKMDNIEQAHILKLAAAAHARIGRDEDTIGLLEEVNVIDVEVEEVSA